MTTTKLKFNQLEDSPIDGLQYARQSGSWTRVTGSYSPPHLYTSILGCHANGYSATGTFYTFPYLSTAQFAVGGFNVPEAGTMKNLYVRLSSAQPATGSLVITVQKNLADTALTVTIAAGTAGGTTHSDTTHTVAWNAGDILTFKVRNNATSASGQLGTFALALEKSTT